MPLPAIVTAGIIQAGTQLAAQGGNAIAQGAANKKSRQWQEKMYGRQRADALADWAMMNDYNHPSAQMARLRQSGLNPNLVYGNGADAQMAAPVRSSDTGSWRPEAPRFDGSFVGETIAQMYNLKQVEAQTDNLRAQNTLLEKDQLLKDAQIANVNANTASTLQNTAGATFDLSQRERLADTNYDAAQASLQKVLADTAFTINQDERAAIMQSQNLKESVQRIINMRVQNSNIKASTKEINQRIKNMQVDKQIKDIELKMKKMGIQPGDPFYVRAATSLVDGIMGDGYLGGSISSDNSFLSDLFGKNWAGFRPPGAPTKNKK